MREGSAVTQVEHSRVAARPEDGAYPPLGGCRCGLT